MEDYYSPELRQMRVGDEIEYQLIKKTKSVLNPWKTEIGYMDNYKDYQIQPSTDIEGNKEWIHSIWKKDYIRNGTNVKTKVRKLKLSDADFENFGFVSLGDNFYKKELSDVEMVTIRYDGADKLMIYRKTPMYGINLFAGKLYNRDELEWLLNRIL